MLIALEERIRQLFISGLSKPEILAIVKDEYQDVNFSEINYEVIDKLTKKEDLEEQRERFRMQAREHFEIQARDNLVKGRVTEQKILDLMSQKIEPILDRIAELDPVEQEEEFFKFLRRMQSVHAIIANLSGTNALRELEKLAREYRTKLALTPKDGKDNLTLDIDAVFLDSSNDTYAFDLN